MRDRCIVSCCYSPQDFGRYRTYADRLERSLDEFGPDADRIIWSKEWPPGSPTHMEMPYAFKFYAVRHAMLLGYRYVMWLDAGTQAIAPIEPLWEKVRTLGYALLNGTDCLGKWISDEALKEFGATREHAMSMKLAGGCLIGLDVDNQTAMSFYDEWSKIVKRRSLMMGANRGTSDVNGVMRSLMLSDADKSVISTDPRVEGHRSDEACFSLIMERLWMKPISYGEWQRVCRTY